MKKLVNKVLFLLLLLTVMINSKEISFRNEIISQQLDSNNKYLIITFFDFSSCVKCYINPSRIIDSLMKGNNYYFNVLAFVSCYRAKDIKNFKYEYNWKFDVLPDIRKKAKSKLGCKVTTDICIFNRKGELIVEVNSSDSFDSNIKIIIGAISK